MEYIPFYDFIFEDQPSATVLLIIYLLQSENQKNYGRVAEVHNSMPRKLRKED